MLYKEIEQEIYRHLTDCHASKRAHFDLADYFYERARIIHYFQSFGLTIILAWLLSNQFNGFLSADDAVVKGVPIILAVIVSVLSIVEHVCRFKEQAHQHEQSAKRYHTLWRSCKNWKTDFSKDEHIEQARVAVQKYREQLNDLNRESPHLSSILWKKIGKVRKASGNKDVSIYPGEEQS